MFQEKPDFHDAELVLRVYELRREPVMRESRGAVNQKFWPKTYEDVQAVVAITSTGAMAGEIGGVGGDLVGDHALPYVVRAGQAKVLFWRDIAEHRRAVPAG